VPQCPIAGDATEWEWKLRYGNGRECDSKPLPLAKTPRINRLRNIWLSLVPSKKQCDYNTYHLMACTNDFITALYGMQTRYSDEKVVRLPVCRPVRLSNACIVTKRKKDLSRFLYLRKII